MSTLRIRYIQLTVVILFFLSPQVTFAGPQELRVHQGEIAASDSKESSRDLTKGDVVLVSLSPTTSVDFKVTGPDGNETECISFEHLGATKKYALIAEASGKYKFILHCHANVARSQYVLGVDKVPAAQSAEEKLNRVLAHWHSSSDPGGVLTLTQDGETRFVGAFGSADVEQRVDVNTSTVFDSASVAKHVTGIAIAMLSNDGKLSLDDDIRKHIPEVPNFGDTITLRHLLHHTSGLRDFPGLMVLGDWHDYDIITLEQVLWLVKQQRELNFSPGSEFTYSNTGYSLLAETVQRVTNENLAEWAEKNLFSPLGMNHSRFLTDVKTIVTQRANGYALTAPHKMVREPNGLAAMGSSSFLTTGEDMALWMANFDSTKVGKEAVGDLMTLRGRSNGGDDLGYGLGIGHGEYRGLQRVEHGGSSGGFRSHLLRFPDERFSVSVLSNQGNFDPGSLAYFATKLYLGEKFDDGPSRTLEPKKEPQRSAKNMVVDTATLDTYVGSYRIQPGEVIEVTRDGKELVLRPKGHPEAPPIKSKALSQTRFTGPPNGSIEFVADANGQITKGLIRDGEKILFEAERLEESEEKISLSEYEGTYFSPELSATCKLLLKDGQLIASQPKRTRQLSIVTSDEFSSNDGIDIKFVRENQEVLEFRASLGTRVRDVQFVKLDD